MKKIILLITLATLSGTTLAYSKCSTDIWGNHNCNYNDGSRSTTSTDIWGRDNTIFSDGTRITCSTDIFGNYICN